MRAWRRGARPCSGHVVGDLSLWPGSPHAVARTVAGSHEMGDGLPGIGAITAYGTVVDHAEHGATLWTAIRLW